MKIGLFDSGKGGTTILTTVQKLLPNEEYRYVADSKNCPYGEKTDAELMQITSDIVEDLISWGAKIIVIACNTATTRCIKKLREKYPAVEFVGTEPAIRLAAKSDARKVLVMATPGTVESERTAQLLAENQKPSQTIELLACAGLADAIEKDENIDQTLEKLLGGVPKDFDLVVLGCTHYSLIKDRIQKYFKNAQLIDGNDGVARRVQIILQKQ